MNSRRLSQSLQILVCVVILLKTEGFNVGITYVENAVAKGVVCLDGSPPAYHHDKGFGAGINSWLVHIETMAWSEISWLLTHCGDCNFNYRGMSVILLKTKYII